MKKSIFNLLTTIVAALANIVLFSSCKDENDELLPGEHFNSYISVYVEDQSGQNLLDAENPDNLIKELEVSVYYDGKKYPIFWDEPYQWDEPYPDKICFFHYPWSHPFYGIWYEYHYGKGHIEVGAFNGFNSWQKNLTIEFPQYGKKYEIEWNHKIKNKKETNTLKVNGETISGSEFTVVL